MPWQDPFHKDILSRQYSRQHFLSRLTLTPSSLSTRDSITCTQIFLMFLTSTVFCSPPLSLDHFFLPGIENQTVIWSGFCHIGQEEKKKEDESGVEEKKKHQLTGFHNATSLPFSLFPWLSFYPSSPVKPFLSLWFISSSVSSPTMIRGSTLVCRNTQTSVTSLSSLLLSGLFLRDI